MTTARLETYLDGLAFPESPRWREGAFWCSDISAHEVCRVDGPGRKAVVVSGLKTPSGLGWTAQGDLLVAAIEASGVYRVGADGAARPFCPFERHGVEATNDMATWGGRSYVTCAGRAHRPGDGLAEFSQPCGKILLIDHATGEGRVVADGLLGPNGAQVTADGRRMIVAETFARRLLAFDVAADGALSAPSVFAELGKLPDGLALDAEGAAWVGLGESFRRVAEGGRVLAEIAVEDAHCVAPALGGPDGRSLFMAVSRYSGADDIFTGRAQGRILRTEVAVPAASTVFADPG
jgi:sugar lactone lactonase YvrE